jgi:hypothetical protein
LLFVLSLHHQIKTNNLNPYKMKATITTIGNQTFLNFFNSKEIYSIKGFDTVRKANNYAKKYGYTIYSELPTGVSDFQYND